MTFRELSCLCPRAGPQPLLGLWFSSGLAASLNASPVRETYLTALSGPVAAPFPNHHCPALQAALSAIPLFHGGHRGVLSYLQCHSAPEGAFWVVSWTPTPPKAVFLPCVDRRKFSGRGVSLLECRMGSFFPQHSRGFNKFSASSPG